MRLPLADTQRAGGVLTSSKVDVGGVENIKAATLRWYHGSSAKAKHLRERHMHTVYDKIRVSDCETGVFYPCALRKLGLLQGC